MNENPTQPQEELGEPAENNEPLPEPEVMPDGYYTVEGPSVLSDTQAMTIPGEGELMSSVRAEDGALVDSEKQQYQEALHEAELIELRARLEKSQEPFSKEDRQEYLKPELLADLEMSEYLEVWRRLSPHVMTHVTRQGYRENHFAYHSGGLGEFHNNFVTLLESGKALKSPLGVKGVEKFSDTRTEMTEFLSSVRFSELELDYNTKVDNYPNAWKKLKLRLTASLGSAPKMPDEIALHLATGEVLNTLYGAETNNQVFMVFPADMVASQFTFAFNGSQFGQTFASPPVSGERKWNDTFVWNTENPDATELPVDAGIVFLPRSTLVSALTGSKYDQYKRGYDEASELKVETVPAEVSVSAEEYWENYFAQNPALRPKHVVYYDGDPTAAMRQFMATEGILATTGSSETDLDFPEHHVQDMHDDEYTQGINNRFLREAAIALKDFMDHSPDGERIAENLTAEDRAEIESLLNSPE